MGDVVSLYGGILPRQTTPERSAGKPGTMSGPGLPLPARAPRTPLKLATTTREAWEVYIRVKNIAVAWPTVDNMRDAVAAWDHYRSLWGRP